MFETLQNPQHKDWLYSKEKETLLEVFPRHGQHIACLSCNKKGTITLDQTLGLYFKCTSCNKSIPMYTIYNLILDLVFSKKNNKKETSETPSSSQTNSTSTPTPTPTPTIPATKLVSSAEHNNTPKQHTFFNDNQSIVQSKSNKTGSITLSAEKEPIRHINIPEYIIKMENRIVQMEQQLKEVTALKKYVHILETRILKQDKNIQDLLKQKQIRNDNAVAENERVHVLETKILEQDDIVQVIQQDVEDVKQYLQNLEQGSQEESQEEPKKESKEELQQQIRDNNITMEKEHVNISEIKKLKQDIIIQYLQQCLQQHIQDYYSIMEKEHAHDLEEKTLEKESTIQAQKQIRDNNITTNTDKTSPDTKISQCNHQQEASPPNTLYQNEKVPEAIKKYPPNNVQLTKEQLALVRIFSGPSPSQGFDYIYLHIKKKSRIYQLRENLTQFGINESRILDIYYPTHNIAALLAHNAYIPEVIKQLKNNNIKPLTDFDPLDHKHINFPEHSDIGEAQRIEMARQIHRNKMLRSLSYMDEPVRYSVAKSFVISGWITTADYEDIINDQ